MLLILVILAFVPITVDPVKLKFQEVPLSGPNLERCRCVLRAKFSERVVFIDKINYTFYCLINDMVIKESEMRTKRKISLTIDEEIYAAIDKASKTLNLAKSQLAQEAFSLWLKKETEALMAKGYEEMAEEDKSFADVTFEAQSETLK